MGASSTHVAISLTDLVRSGLFSRVADAKIQAKMDGVARQNPLRLAKSLKTQDRGVAERVGFFKETLSFWPKSMYFD